MLRIDPQRARSRETEPRSNRSFSKSQRGDPVPRRNARALPEPKPYLREGLTVAALQRIAAAVSDTEAAQRMQQAKRKLFEQLRPSAQRRWK